LNAGEAAPCSYNPYTTSYIRLEPGQS